MGGQVRGGLLRSAGSVPGRERRSLGGARGSDEELVLSGELASGCAEPAGGEGWCRDATSGSRPTSPCRLRFVGPGCV